MTPPLLLVKITENEDGEIDISCNISLFFQLSFRGKIVYT